MAKPGARANLDLADATRLCIEKVEELLNEASLLCALRPLVTQFSREHWSWHLCARDYYHFFSELLDHGRLDKIPKEHHSEL